MMKDRTSCNMHEESTHWQKPGLSLISGYQLQYTLSALREEEFFPIKIVEISSSSKRSLKLIDEGIGFSRNFVENFCVEELYLVYFTFGWKKVENV